MGSWIVKNQLLAERGHTKIFLATEADCQRRVVAKSAEADHAESLKTERDVYYNLPGDCPNVVTCYGYYRSYDEDGDEDEDGAGDEREMYSLMLEYASEGSMEDLMKNGKLIVKGSAAMSVADQIRAYSKMILNGLEHIHESGYVHCNLDPTNILAFLPDEDELDHARNCYTLKISDYKLSKRAGERVKSYGSKRTYWSRFRGNKPRYMSPESVLFDDQHEPPMDIWALGCIVAEMSSALMTGGLPVREHVKVAARRVLLGVAPEIPKNMCFWGVHFLNMCFEVMPERRWTAKELLEHPFITGGIACFGYIMGRDVVELKAEEEDQEVDDEDSWGLAFYGYDSDADLDADDDELGQYK